MIGLWIGDDLPISHGNDNGQSNTSALLMYTIRILVANRQYPINHQLSTITHSFLTTS